MTRHLERWAVDTLFLDMNGTFMFGHDRFGHGEDYFDTYRTLGGRNLASTEVNQIIAHVVSCLATLYQTPGKSGALSVRQVAEQFVAEEDDRDVVEKTVAAHERGWISGEDACALHELSRRYKLVLVSNLWSRSGPWRRYLEEQNIISDFSHIIFSSDIGVAKLSAEFFEFAVAACGTHPSRIVMIGDDYWRDIIPANGLGMKTIWICEDSSDNGVADETISRLLEVR